MNQYYSFFPDKKYYLELIRPWKLFSFCVAMSFLLYGTVNYEIRDWDVRITILMCVLTYLMAPWSVYIILSAIRYRTRYWVFHIIAALIAGLFVVDWVYMLYHTIVFYGRCFLVIQRYIERVYCECQKIGLTSIYEIIANLNISNYYSLSLSTASTSTLDSNQAPIINSNTTDNIPHRWLPLARLTAPTNNGPTTAANLPSIL